MSAGPPGKLSSSCSPESLFGTGQQFQQPGSSVADPIAQRHAASCQAKVNSVVIDAAKLELGGSSTVATAVSSPSDSGGTTKVSPMASFRSSSPTGTGSRHEPSCAHDLGARVAFVPSSSHRSAAAKPRRCRTGPGAGCRRTADAPAGRRPVPALPPVGPGCGASGRRCRCRPPADRRFGTGRCECSRKRPTMLLTRIDSLMPGTPGAVTISRAPPSRSSRRGSTLDRAHR